MCESSIWSHIQLKYCVTRSRFVDKCGELSNHGNKVDSRLIQNVGWNFMRIIIGVMRIVYVKQADCIQLHGKTSIIRPPFMSWIECSLQKGRGSATPCICSAWTMSLTMDNEPGITDPLPFCKENPIQNIRGGLIGGNNTLFIHKLSVLMVFGS